MNLSRPIDINNNPIAIYENIDGTVKVEMFIVEERLPRT